MRPAQGLTASQCQSWNSNADLFDSNIYLFKKYTSSSYYVPGTL